MAIRDAFRDFLGLPVFRGQPPPLAPIPGPEATWLTRAEMIAKHKAETQSRAIDSYTSYPGWEAQMLAVQGLTARPWRYPSVTEALGVPAIFRAVSLIANTTGSLALEAFRNGVKLDDDATPALIKRPDPLRIPRDFYRDTAFYQASRGEFWWWVAARDIDGKALSLIVVPPWEVTVESSGDRLRPIVKWLDKEMDPADMVHGTFLPDGYRGVGPLQMCGAAVSVAVESQEWAANFFIEDGGYPSVVIKSATELGVDPETGVNEADTLRDQWMSKPHNTPRVVDPGIEDIEEFGANSQGSQMLQAREYQNGDAARMFGIPGALLEYNTAGSSLTYQNVAEVYTQFVRTTLAPNYLEPIEQAMSDLLTRSTVARFNVKGFLRADIKTRYDVYAIGIDKGILTVEQAQAEEGIVAGDVEYAPVPFAPPQAIPERLPVTRSEAVRCDGKRLLKGVIRPCGKLLAEAGPFIGRCPRCGKEHTAVA
jgi:HK97 family phage portal protein